MNVSSSIISVVMLLGIISLSSANRIPPQQKSCITACLNYAKNCGIEDCPLESCDINDRDCFFKECLASFGCTFEQKRENIETIVEEI